MKPRLRDSKNLKNQNIYTLGDIPKDVIIKIASHFVYLSYMGRKDIDGGDWADAFAQSIDGVHLDSPLGIADVVLNNHAWSAKTIKNTNPFKAQNIRLISGRCSPDFSYGISDPHKDIQQTGRAVLGIWNERVNIAQDNFSSLRTIILVRNFDLSEFIVFEKEAHRFPTNEFIWECNKNGNLIGKDSKNNVCFTWQPHGSQFTIHEQIPQSSIKFKLQAPPKANKNEILENLNFSSSWVEFVN